MKSHIQWLRADLYNLEQQETEKKGRNAVAKEKNTKNKSNILSEDKTIPLEKL